MNKFEMEKQAISQDISQSNYSTNEQTIPIDNFSEWEFVWRRIVPIILVSFAVKCLLAWSFLFTGDEAYHVIWGKNIAPGYYDHPPLIGWLLNMLLNLGRSIVLMRLPPILFSTAVGVGIYLLLRPFGRRKAFLVFLLYIISPVNMAFFAILTDAPLFLFSFFSVFFLFKAERKNSYLFYLLSGLCLGLAFLSKYFAVLLGFSYLLYLLVSQKNSKKVKGFLLLALAAFPFVVQNTIWNYQNGWPNIMHNLVNRSTTNSSPLVNLLCFVIFLSYLITPPVLYFLLKNRRGILRMFREDNFSLFAMVSVIPACVLFAVSLKRAVRPHWYLSFFPFVYVMAAFLLNNVQIVKSIKFSLIFSLLQVLLVIGASFFPVAKLKGLISEHDLTSLVTYMRPREVLGPLAEYKGRFVLATKSYSRSALLEYYSGERVIVFGKGSKHGRHDDILTDFKELDGKDIVIMRKGTRYDSEFKQCFDRMEIRHFSVENANFTLLLGYGFKYQEYRERYLLTILEKYYQIPDWLPGSRSFFHEKYDFQIGN
ncbi:MAG: ArnT family glycosyltransferase [Planctomycetota bacterium]|jgi:hypothetical protein